MMLPFYVRYVRTGDKIPHPTRDAVGGVTSINFTPATETPGRPWGVVSGWMTNPNNPSEQWAWSYPAETLLIVERASGNVAR